MKRIFPVLAVLGLLLAVLSFAPTAAAAGECPAGYTSKVDTSDGSIVLAAGLTICIKAGDDNTGTFTTDGTSTLADYIEASGLLNNGGQVPNVSHYVIYATPSAPPSTPPSSVCTTR